MPTDPFFRLTVEDVFMIAGRGTVVIGQIESGALEVGNEVRILSQSLASKTATVTGIEMLRKQLQQAKAGDNVGILLRGVNKTEVHQGDILVGTG